MASVLKSMLTGLQRANRSDVVPGSQRQHDTHTPQITAAINRIGMHRHFDRACAHSPMHTHTNAEGGGGGGEHMHTLSQMWTCQTEMNTNQNKACKHKEIQRMKTTERIAQSHLSNKCEDASHTHTYTHTL